MCEAGNGTIFAECRDIVRQKLGRRGVSNQEMRQAINKNGGCLAVHYEVKNTIPYLTNRKGLL